MSSTRTDPRLRTVALLNVKQVSELLNVHVPSVWRMSATKEIPQPIRISERVVRWRLRDIETWLDKQR